MNRRSLYLRQFIGGAGAASTMQNKVRVNGYLPKRTSTTAKRIPASEYDITEFTLRQFIIRPFIRSSDVIFYPKDIAGGRKWTKSTESLLLNSYQILIAIYWVSSLIHYGTTRKHT